jgi:hypothetical protein
MLDLEYLIKVILRQWLVLLIVLADLLFLFLHFVLNGQLLFATLNFRCNHENVV